MSKFVTKEGLEKMKQELEHLKTTKQKEVAERLRRAIAFGDLSENFEYSDAKEEQAMLQARIAELEEEIREAKVVEDSGKTDEVQIGCQVKVEANGSPLTFTIVTGKEANPLEGKVSAESPIGEALLRKKVGETAKVETPSGMVHYKVIGIS